MAEPSEVEELRRLLLEEQQARQQAEQQNEKTTLEEFLGACHELSKCIDIETNASLTTGGDPTTPYNRKYPKRIISWDRLKRPDIFVGEEDSPSSEMEMDFPDLQKEVWERFHLEPTFLSKRLFASLNQLEYVKSTIETVSDEMSLRHYVHDTVENMVRFGLEEVYKIEVLRGEFQLRGKVTFESHLNLGQGDQMIDETMQQLSIDEPSTPIRGRGRGSARGRARGGRRADRFCIYHCPDKSRIATLAIEYKAPHKLSQDDIVTGLGEIEPDRDIINKNDKSRSFNSKRLMTAIITQLFSYMIEVGLQYGYICTGEAFIFLKIADDPSSVYYYLSIPNHDVEQSNDRHRTAVAQVLAFTLHALAAEPPSQSWHDAAARLATWDVEFDDVLRDMPTTDRRDRDHTPYSPTPYEAGSWEPVIRSRVKTRSQCHPPAHQIDDDDTTPPTPSPGDRRQGGTTRGTRGTRRTRGTRGTGRTRGTRGTRGAGGTRGTERRGGKDGSEKSISRQYCTQKCLRGLLTRGTLDTNCPNVEDHSGNVQDQDKHAISPSTFLRLVRSQLARDRDSNCEPLYIQGARGALFKLVLASHGYTVAAKGTISTLIPYLRHEATVYKRLRSLQGVCIPVCLGAIDLVRPYYNNGSQIVHMLFLGWGGTRIDRHIDCNNMCDVLAQATSSLQAIHRLGVLHHDAMPRNMLWNTEGGVVMVVDFERAKAVERKVTKKRTELGTISSNQRAWKTKTKWDGETRKGNDENDTLYTMEVKDMRVELARHAH